MHRKLSSSFGKTSSSEEFISQHMSNHYRRILNAKKVIDTSAPLSYKPKISAKKGSIMNKRNSQIQNRNESPAVTERSVSSNSYKASSWGAESVINSSRFHSNCVPLGQRSMCARRHTFVDLDLINQIVYDTKNGPAIYCDAKCRLKHEKDRKSHKFISGAAEKPKTTTSTSRCPLSTKCSNDSNQTSASSTQKKSKVMSKQTQPYGPKPRPKKIEAVSKLRSLRVYYPPRRKKKRDENENCPGISHAIRDKCLEICICSANGIEVKKLSDGVKEQTSSRDSAYNGGVSSLPESRSPTPDHKSKLTCGCASRGEIYIKDRHYYEEETKNEDAVSHPMTNIPPEKSKSEEAAFKKMKEDALYVKFVQDITVEILEKGLFTNKALKKVMRKHIINNLKTLNKARMIAEVENLRIQLGVPEDKSMLEVETNKDDSSSLSHKVYPVVSDSAFTLPESLKGDQIDSKKLAKPSSHVVQMNEESDIETTTDDDLISIIQVAKNIRERNSPMDMSSDEGNEKKKKRPKVGMHPKQRTTQKSYSSYSSESEESNKKLMKEPKKQTGVDKMWKSRCMCKGGNECENRHLEGKHIRLVVYENNTQKNFPKTKPKND